MRRIKSAVPLKLQSLSFTSSVRFNAAITFCFSQTTRESKFDGGGNRILSAQESLSGKP